MKKKQLKIVLDAVIWAIMLLLMAYALVGETAHEILGASVLVLFIVHHILNKQWFKALFKGRYGARRIFQTILNLVLLVLMIAQPVSGILMSKRVFTFIDIPGAASPAREIHLCLAYWSFILMSLHAGTHFAGLIKKLAKQSGAAKIALSALIIAACAYGGYAFFRRGFPDYMLRRVGFAFFDYSESLIWYLLDCACIAWAFAILGLFIAFALGKLDKRINKKGLR